MNQQGWKVRLQTFRLEKYFVVLQCKGILTVCLDLLDQREGMNEYNWYVAIASVLNEQVPY